MNLRPGFADIVSGWMLVDDFDDLTDRIERAGAWAKENGPLNEDEQATISLMIEAQVARGVRRGDFEPYISRDAPWPLEADPADDVPDLGPCCICETTEAVHNVMMIDRRAPVPGHGWGCLVCDLANDGASAVFCDRCAAGFLANDLKLRFVCRGYPTEGRIPFDELPPEPFAHDKAKHAADDLIRLHAEDCAIWRDGTCTCF